MDKLVRWTIVVFGLIHVFFFGYEYFTWGIAPEDCLAQGGRISDNQTMVRISFQETTDQSEVSQRNNPIFALRCHLDEMGIGQIRSIFSDSLCCMPKRETS